MSVAFRRESDEEHKEPRFELPLPPGPNLVRPSGLTLIEDRIAKLEAATPGDDTAREAIARELRYWQTRRVTAIVAPPPPTDEIAFGSRVRFSLDGEERTITIVGDDEADPASGLIAFSAPLARALIGEGQGDLVAFNGVSNAIEITAVDPSFTA